MKKLIFLITLILSICYNYNFGMEAVQTAAFIPSFEYNRTLDEKLNLRASYRIILDGHYEGNAGVSYDVISGSVNGIFIGLGYVNFPGLPLSGHLKLLTNPYLEYHKSVNSLIAYLSWEGDLLFADLGLHFRFWNEGPDNVWNLFYFSGPVSETFPYYRFGLQKNFADENLNLSVEFNNHDDFFAGNLGNVGYAVSGQYKVNDVWTGLASVSMRQSGVISLTATYYEFFVDLGGEVRL